MGVFGLPAQRALVNRRQAAGLERDAERRVGIGPPGPTRPDWGGVQGPQCQACGGGYRSPGAGLGVGVGLCGLSAVATDAYARSLIAH